MALFSEYDSHDAVGLADLVRRRSVSAVELLDTALARLAEVNPAINAVINTFENDARRSVSGLKGDELLSGVPFLLKDSGIQWQGVRTSAGSRLLHDHVAKADSTIAGRYRRAGLVPFGSTNTSEFGLVAETNPVAYGPTRNPWGSQWSIGGSSGGAAAAVAAGIVPVAHATDGGGSIRIPASHAGVLGLKPSRARNPYGPDAGEGWNGLSVHHVISRSVRDSAAVLDASHGPASGDPYAAPPFEGRYLKIVAGPSDRLRIAFQTVDHEGRTAHPSVVAVVEKAAAFLSGLGHQVEEVRAPVDGVSLKRATRTIVASNTANTLHHRGEATGRPVSESDVEPVTWAWAQEGRRLSGSDLADAIGQAHRIGRGLGVFFEGYDILLTPVFSSVPLLLGTITLQNPDLDDFYEKLRQYSAYTSLYNATGVPAASVPFAIVDGLPIGIQIAAAYGRDDRVLGLAADIERARPWFDLRPPAAGSPS